MKISYDAEAQAVHVQLRRGKIYETREISDVVLADFDRNGNVLNMELLGISALEKV